MTAKPIIAADNFGKIDEQHRTMFCTVFGLNKVAMKEGIEGLVFSLMLSALDKSTPFLA